MTMGAVRNDGQAFGMTMGAVRDDDLGGGIQDSTYEERTVARAFLTDDLG